MIRTFILEVLSAGHLILPIFLRRSNEGRMVGGGGWFFRHAPITMSRAFEEIIDITQ